MIEYSYFDIIPVLKSQLNSENQLVVMHGSHIWTADFEWRDRLMNIEFSKHKFWDFLPLDYQEFLRIHNGAVLYKDSQYGQWGFHLYGLDEIEAKNREWESSLLGKWEDKYIAFAENKGESNVLAFDTSCPTSDGESYTVVEANPFENSQNWCRISRSFHEWLEHLITAQGDKYWEWH
jgi:hypothetical protein